ncbi:MAG: carbon storage regulator [Bacillota bacterium]|jgi:carbon storage regulator|nr:carbon storage regulator [Candidatus Fermentithermobacillaceae bacterium]HOA70278.1 carbon storage regulator [Bacillota bacterium]HOP70202.1 carbon storage regulator [Bacillota bacterium]HPT35350.1 carbon storage regulator [Bacillota bacterium]HPZ84764.1 carbon storage regulator [Bacillota bacterium]
MLVLSRRVGEAILIGDDIVVRVIEVRGRGPRAAVKLGIEAPLGTKVLREEVEIEVRKEMMEAKDPVLDVLDGLERELSNGVG